MTSIRVGIKMSRKTDSTTRLIARVLFIDQELARGAHLSPMLWFAAIHDSIYQKTNYLADFEKDMLPVSKKGAFSNLKTNERGWETQKYKTVPLDSVK